MLLKQNLSLSLSKDLIEQIDSLKNKLWLSRSEVTEKLLKESIDKQLMEDAKKLSTIKFDDLPNEEEWIVLQNN